MKKITHINQVPPDKGHYIAGFVDGEGSFYISARKRTDYLSGWSFELHFNISNRDLAIMQICKKFLGCGLIRQTRPGFYTLEVENRKTLSTYIIPFFKKFGFLSNKKKTEFRIFQHALILLEQGINTPKNLEQLLQLRKRLNEFRNTRITNTDSIILASFNFVKESSETIR
uniref:Putative site-specific DNA endonuclease n=1 Tax=Chaetosphaeridium globosum TaxID=96477 RepID=Q8M1H6_CHAGL|nr:putative site-specific DNA endonuclease [Chaetosphaeridium globosum]AAM96632.1 putative site-specific DNA endonuclease [Chaetosphaeridium globosum]